MQDAGLAEEGGADGLRKRKFADDFGERTVEDGVHDGEKAGEEEVIGVGNGGAEGELFAEVGTGEGGAEEFIGLVSGGSDHGDDGSPAAEFLIAEEGDGIADGADLDGPFHDGRIEIAEEFVGEGGFLADHGFDFREIQRIFENRAEEAESVEAGAGNFAPAKELRLKEEISLEQSEAETAGGFVVFPSSDILGDEGGVVIAIAGGDAGALAGSEGVDIRAQIIGQDSERAAFTLGFPSADGEAVAGVLEFLAGEDDFGAAGDVRADINDGFGAREEQGGAAGEFAGLKGQKSQAAADERLPGKNHGKGVNGVGGGRRDAGLGGGIAVAEEQVVAEQGQIVFKDGVTGDEAIEHSSPQQSAERSEPCEKACRRV